MEENIVHVSVFKNLNTCFNKQIYFSQQRTNLFSRLCIHTEELVCKVLSYQGQFLADFNQVKHQINFLYKVSSQDHFFILDQTDRRLFIRIITQISVSFQAKSRGPTWASSRPPLPPRPPRWPPSRPSRPGSPRPTGSSRGSPSCSTWPARCPAPTRPGTATAATAR